MPKCPKDLVIEYLESEKQIRSISQERDDFRGKKEKEITDLKWEVYEPKIRALEEERDEKVSEINEESNARVRSLTEKIAELNETVEKVERVLSFLKPTRKSAEWLDFDESTVKAYGDYCEKIGTFYRDDFLKIVAYIAENRKPKNKYTLALVGRCFFKEKQMKFPYSYGLDLNIFGQGLTVAIHITDKPTIDGAKTYFTKNKEKILKLTMEKYQEVKKEYLDVRKTYTTDDFKELIAYRCLECGFFYTEREANRISRIESSSCPNCEKGSFGRC